VVTAAAGDRHCNGSVVHRCVRGVARVAQVSWCMCCSRTEGAKAGGRRVRQRWRDALGRTFGFARSRHRVPCGQNSIVFSFHLTLIGAAIDTEGWSRKRARCGQAPHRRAAGCPACPPRPVTYPTAFATLLVVATLPRSPPPCCFSFSFFKSTALLPASCGLRTGDRGCHAAVASGTGDGE